MDYRDKIYSVKHHSIGIAEGIDDLYAMPHHDNSIEIIQFWSDSGHFVVGNHIFPIKAGCMLLLDAMQIHYSNPTNPEEYNRSKLIISKELFNLICNTCGLDIDTDNNFFKTGVLYCPFNITDNSIMLIDNCYKLAAQHYIKLNDPYAQANIVSSLITILTLTFPKIKESNIQQNTQTIDLLANYVSSCSDRWDDITMEKICSNLHISPSRASHLFKELTGKSLTQYITLLRMTEAKRLLLESNLKVKDISCHLKFDDPTTFCRYFRKYVGCSPNEYRASNGISSPPPNLY
ncbi:MAG: helix-turn-helix transcriptional regulator [Lachnospiraceae bacterium]|nr:helix-turn-helix transcriptional regulator [Lachnospiraceae bacterium]MBP3594385.1 helix-turn-helix transcriptional regulator [Lachnospiraceae bacterium]